MNYSIDPNGSEAGYLQLYRQLRADIVQQVYPYGGKLPSKRVCAAETGVSTVTVEHAYELLCDEGYLEPRERSGYYVIFRTTDGFAGGETAPVPPPPRPAAQPSGAVFPYSVLAKTVRRVLTDDADAILQKSPNAGCMPLRRALQQYLARSRGIRVSCEQIVIGAGSEYLYSLIVELLGRDRTYAIEAPSYAQIEQVYRAMDLRFEALALGPDGIDSAALWRSNADVLHISPYRSFPSGVSASASKRHEYLRWAARPGHCVVEDDFESEFSVSRKPEDTLFSQTRQDNVIYLNTFSKTISPALRVGYMVLPASMVEPFTKHLGFYSCTVATFEQLILARLLDSGDFERHINRVRRALRRRNLSGG